MEERIKEVRDSLELINMLYQTKKSSGSTIHLFRNKLCSINAELGLVQEKRDPTRLSRIIELVAKLEEWVNSQN